MLSPILSLALLLALLVVPGGAPDSPEVDWFVYSQSDHVLRWQTIEEYDVAGFFVAYGPQVFTGLPSTVPPALWLSGFIPAQHPGTGTGALYELPVGAGRMHDVWLCVHYLRTWRCTMQPEAAK